MAVSLSHARELSRSARWDEACHVYLAVPLEDLGMEDVERLAEAAQLTGRFAEAGVALERSFDLRADVGDVDGAAAAAFSLFLQYLFAGEFARASGWMSRVTELAAPTGAVPGWLSITTAYGLIGQGLHEDARAVLADILAGPSARGNADLQAYAILLTGRALVAEGRPSEGLARLDDAMLRVTGGQTSPRITSTLYCAAIGTCEEDAADLARALEWARDLERWMSALPSPIGGALMQNCRVYRAVLKRRRGQWAEAAEELGQAARELADGHGSLVAGHAYYELAEVHRMRGDAARAEVAYRRATALGASPQPGLALLRLAQGERKTAAAGLRRALAETQRPPDRARLLPAFVTVMVADGAIEEASAGAEELMQLSVFMGTSAMKAWHAHAIGEVALASGAPERALPSLRSAADVWRQLRMPYETAHAVVLIGTACRALGDEEGARLEFESACEIFERLGAAGDLERLDPVLRPPAARHGLSPRELEVLALLSAGKTNRAIADALYLSERTVHRHVGNIFDKLGVASRTEAATFAVENGLVVRATTRKNTP